MRALRCWPLALAALASAGCASQPPAAIEVSPGRVPVFRDEPRCAAARPLAPDADVRTCVLPGAFAIRVDVRSDPDHCGECFRACDGCADGECPPGMPITVRLGSHGQATASDVAVRDDTVVLVGAFREAFRDDWVGLDVGQGELRSHGASDGAVVAYDAQLHRRWGVRLGGSGDDFVTRAAVAPDGDVVVVGSFWRELRVGSLGPYPGDARDAFVLRLTPDGALRWVHFVGGSGDEEALALAVDARAAAHG